MSALLAETNVDQTIIPANGNEGMTDDDQLGAVFDKFERDNGAERENGKFVSPDPEKRAAVSSPVAAEGEEPAGGGPAPLPAAWAALRGEAITDAIKDAWSKADPALRSFVDTREGELTSRLTEQGRQISGLKPVLDVFDKHKDYFDGRHKMPDGSGLTPAAAVAFLFNAQRHLDKDPIGGLLAIADRYGVRDKLAEAFGKTVPEGESELRRELAGLKELLSRQSQPVNVDERIEAKLQEAEAERQAAEEVGRLSKDKPLFSEIPQEDLLHSIDKARRRLGATASNKAVFDLAYDMAVNADPDLRAKAAAAVKAAAPDDARKVEGAKRAASINLTSTSSGKGRDLTEEEELGLVYDRNRKG